MLSLMILMILVSAFIILAIKNWGKEIGAGPTILIVGAIIVSAFWAVKYDSYRTQLREYDYCRGRVERSEESYLFNNALVTIIERELPQEPFATELRSVMVMPLTMETCGDEPVFFNHF